ncbi:MAG: hypothetical protein EA426_16945, partial [Spirochaetaceae bacterium]
MKILIVHDSRTGNGEKVADTLRGLFESRGADVTVGHVTTHNPTTAAESRPDLLIVGAAIRKFQLSRTSKRWIAAFDKESRTAGHTVRYAAVFVTHALPERLAASWANRFRRRVTRCTAITGVYPDWISARVLAIEGPLAETVEADLERHAQAVWDGVR